MNFCDNFNLLFQNYWLSVEILSFCAIIMTFYDIVSHNFTFVIFSYVVEALV